MIPSICLFCYPLLNQWWLRYISQVCRDHFVYASSQWDVVLHCNIVSHWLDAYTKWSLRYASLTKHSQRDYFVYEPSQWEAMLHCNITSHWLGTYTTWSLSQYRLCGSATGVQFIWGHLLSLVYITTAGIVVVCHILWFMPQIVNWRPRFWCECYKYVGHISLLPIFCRSIYLAFCYDVLVTMAVDLKHYCYKNTL